MCKYKHAQNFAEAMALASLASKETPIADGKIHRFHVQGDKPGSMNGWYVFYGEVGVYGSWRTNEKFTWAAKGTHISTAVNNEIKRQLAQVRSNHKRERHKGQLKAAEGAQKKWFTSPPANPLHPYLLNKAVRPHSLRQDGNYLLVPLFDFDGTLWNVQTIFANGDKRFETGGRVSGLYSPIGAETMNGISKIVICEGWATGATLHEVMGEFVLCAMNAGNLLHVAQGARERFPDAEIIIAADNDRFTDGNPGLAKALEAARLINAMVMVPNFPHEAKGTDYNDAFQLGWRG